MSTDKHQSAAMTSQPLIGQMREQPRVLRHLTTVVLGFFLWFNVHPAAAAIKQEIENPTPAKQATADDDPHAHAKLFESLANELGALRARLKPAHDLIVKRTYQDSKGRTITDIRITGRPEERPVNEGRERLNQIADALDKEYEATLAAFERDRAHIERHRLPDVIQQRHAEAVRLVKERHQELKDGLDVLTKTQTVVALHAQTEALLRKVEEWNPAPVSTFDPKNLPFRVPESKVRLPRTKPQELQDILNPNLVQSKAPLLETAERRQRITERELAALDQETDLARYQALSKGATEVASLNATSLLAVSAITPPGPEFLAPTEDVQITPAIQQKAQELNNNPVEIYNWVRNNVEYVPTYGSIQGSQMTLDKQSGNAFDTASLLIALLRAAGIPARYVYGTVDIPIDKAMNWVGGMEDADATQTLMATGGIPNTGLTQGGKTVAIRMEHVWVEALVDFYPSRGAKNITPDAWVPMDASFKQYIYTEGMALGANVPLDVNVFVEGAKQGGTINEQQGWVQNLNQGNIQSQLGAYQQQLQSHIENQNPDATVGEVLGGRAVQPINAPTLAAALPYRLVVRSNINAALPDHFQNKFRYALYSDAHQRALENPLFVYEATTAQIAGKKIVLVYVPTTQADLQTLTSYLPQANSDGTPILLHELPQQFPAYSIRVTPQLRMEGVTIASGGSYPLGTELLGEGSFTKPFLTDWDVTLDRHIAGQTGALGLSLQGVSSKQLEVLKQSLQETQGRLQTQQLEELTGEMLSGDFLTAAIWGYFSAVESFGRIAQRGARMVDIPGLSYGYFFAQVMPIRRYGIVQIVRFPGLLMDVGHQRRIAYSIHNSRSEWIQYNKIRGQHSSAMEHEIPKKFFKYQNELSASDGISAVKALAVAASSGQRVYTFTSQNMSQLSQINHSAETLDNIQIALAAGQEVTIHSQPIDFAGFKGAGYVITDPLTGGGAYIIEGGASGGSLSSILGALNAVVSAFSDNIGDILGVLKTVLLEIAQKTVLAYLDLLVELIVNLSKVWSECDGVLKYSMGTLLTTFAILGFAVPLLLFSGFIFPLIFSIIFGLIYSRLVEASLNYCQHASLQRLRVLPVKAVKLEVAGYA